MNEPLQTKLRELNWRRPLTEAEQAELHALLAQNPEALAGWQSETELTRLLGKLPDAPVSSNFTARVLQAVELESKIQEHGSAARWFAWLAHGWLPRVTAASLLVCTGLFAFHRHNLTARKNLARDVVAVSAVAVVSNPSVLEDFEAIQHLNKRPAADRELLALLK